MSESYYGLSETEHELMKYFWASDQPLSFAKIYEHCTVMVINDLIIQKLQRQS